MVEPAEEVTIEVPEHMSGTVIDQMNKRMGVMSDMQNFGQSSCRLVFVCPSRGLFGLRAELMRASRGEAIVNSVLHSYVPAINQSLQQGNRGAIISMGDGTATTHALEALEARGTLFIKAHEKCYDGMIIGESSKADDYEVNPTKQKDLNNFRAAGKEDFVRLKPPRVMPLEELIGYVEDDELLEVTPKSLRLRKKALTQSLRAREAKSKKARRAA